MQKTEVLPRHRNFTSDNAAAACPEVIQALERANRDHAPSYGEDSWTKQARNLIQQLFETDCDFYPVSGGTAANALAISTACQSINSVICHRHSHVRTDECGAPGFFSHGITLRHLDSEDGKLGPAQVKSACLERTDVHAPIPRVVSVTQATELGTVYKVEEIKALSHIAKESNLILHMDGARFANAVTHLEVKPAEITWKAGVDVLSLGGTKNGAAMTDAVVFFNKDLAKSFEWRMKQAGQLASKMRFLSAQWVGLLENDVWQRNALRANSVAQMLSSQIKKIGKLPVLFPPEANSIFVKMPKELIDGLHKRGWRFYCDYAPDLARLMSSWDSMEEDVDAFLADIKALMK